MVVFVTFAADLIESLNNLTAFSFFKYHSAEVFAKKRGPDVEALVKLARFSYPWQYAQSRLGQGLWAMNFALRSLLHRFIPGLFADHSFMLIQSGYALPYREIWRRAHRTTAVASV